MANTTFTKWGKKEFREYLNGEGKEQAERFVRNLKKGNIVAVVKHVAKSGMSREVCFYALEANEDGRIYPYEINRFIARAGGFRIATDHHGFETDVVLNGCGFDVVYASLEDVYNNIKQYTDLTDKSFSDVYRGYSLL